MITFLKKNSAFKLVRPKTRLTVAEMIHSTEQNDTRIRFVVQKVKQASAHCNKKVCYFLLFLKIARKYGNRNSPSEKIFVLFIGHVDILLGNNREIPFHVVFLLFSSYSFIFAFFYTKWYTR